MTYNPLNTLNVATTSQVTNYQTGLPYSTDLGGYRNESSRPSMAKLRYTLRNFAIPLALHPRLGKNCTRGTALSILLEPQCYTALDAICCGGENLQMRNFTNSTNEIITLGCVRAVQSDTLLMCKATNSMTD